MKFVISLFILLPLKVSASPIHVYHEAISDEAGRYRDLLTSEYKIPEDLILMKTIKTCEGLKGEGKLDLCLKNNGDLLVVSVDRSFVNESLKVFRAP
jgi:hypothetical protein